MGVARAKREDVIRMIEAEVRCTVNTGGTTKMKAYCGSKTKVSGGSRQYGEQGVEVLRAAKVEAEGIVTCDV